ncbi:hypothetical protein JCM3770_002367 [Rhodotorula araucariae]
MDGIVAPVDSPDIHALPNKLPVTVDEVKGMLDARLVGRLKRAAGAVSALLKEENGAVIVEKTQFCYQPVGPNREPIIGLPSPIDPTVYISTAKGPWGITQAPSAGKVVAELGLILRTDMGPAPAWQTQEQEPEPVEELPQRPELEPQPQQEPAAEEGWTAAALRQARWAVHRLAADETQAHVEVPAPLPTPLDVAQPLAPIAALRSRSPPPSSHRDRRRSFSRSPPPSLPPPSHAPFTARLGSKRDLAAAAAATTDDDEDMIFRKARRLSRSDSITSGPAPSVPRPLPSQSAAMDEHLRRRVSRSPMSPSPPPPPPPQRARSPGPSGYSRFRSPSPPPPSRFRSPSPPSHGRGRDEPALPSQAQAAAVPIGPRGFRPISEYGGPGGSGGAGANSIPTGPRNRYPSLPLAAGAAAGGVKAPPTGPKAWRAGHTAPVPAPAEEAAPAPTPTAPPRDEWDRSPAPAAPARAPSETPPPPPPSEAELAARAAEDARRGAEQQARDEARAAEQQARDEARAAEQRERDEARARERDEQRAKWEVEDRRRRLGRFLPRAAGGMLATIPGMQGAWMISPGTDYEAEIIRLRRDRITSFPNYHTQLLAARKVDFALLVAQKDADAARERTRLAGGGLAGGAVGGGY